MSHSLLWIVEELFCIPVARVRPPTDCCVCLIELLISLEVIVVAIMFDSWSMFAFSSSGSDRHGILSTMHLDIGSKDWDQTCSRLLSHLEVPLDGTADREAGTYQYACCYVYVLCMYIHAWFMHACVCNMCVSVRRPSPALSDLCIQVNTGYWFSCLPVPTSCWSSKSMRRQQPSSLPPTTGNYYL